MSMAASGSVQWTWRKSPGASRKSALRVFRAGNGQFNPIRSSFVIAMVAALVLGLINTLIRPLLLLVTLPLNILTLGLLTLVINALMFWFATVFFEGFRVAGFWSAFWGAIAYSLISALASWLLVPPPPREA